MNMKNPFEGELSPNEEKQGLSIEEQAKRRETVEILGGPVEVIDVLPEEPTSEVPTVLAPAWGVRPRVYQYNIEGLAKDGRRVISVDSPHGVEVEKAEDFPTIELRKMTAIMQALDEKGIEQADVVAHSEGGLYMTIAATLHPGRIRNMVLVDPAGIIGKDNVFDLGKRFGEDAALETERRKTKTERDLSDPKDFQKTLLSSPWKALQEVLAISNADIRGMLRELKARGVGISIIHSVEDKGFPMERVQVEKLPGENDKEFKARVEKIRIGDEKAVSEMKGNIDTSMVDGFYSVKGTHNEFIQRPDRYTKLAAHALDAMEKKQKKQRGQEGGA